MYIHDRYLKLYAAAQASWFLATLTKNHNILLLQLTVTVTVTDRAMRVGVGLGLLGIGK